MSCFIFFELLISKNVVACSLYTWVMLDVYRINIGFLFDSLSGLMCVVVCTISLLVHIYSLGYMSHDPYLVRFMSYLSLFTFSMLLVVVADNFLLMFLG
jgi:NADH-quinone oxidoreductase subunit L